MELNQIIQRLYKERVKLDQLIASLEQQNTLAVVKKKLKKKRRGRKTMGEEERQEVSERMKKYWAARRKTGLTSAPAAQPAAPLAAGESWGASQGRADESDFT
jgi:hypothetical protein